MPAASNVVRHNLGDTYQLTADWSPGVYATGGVVIAPTDVGVSPAGAIEFIDCPAVVGSRLFETVLASGVWKVKAYSALGTEVSNSTDLSAVSLKLQVTGR